MKRLVFAEAFVPAQAFVRLNALLAFARFCFFSLYLDVCLCHAQAAGPPSSGRLARHQ
jgi:hypothetical protein